MNLNRTNAFMIRLVPESTGGELNVSMTAVPDGTRTVFAAPSERWDDYAQQLHDKMGVTPDALREAAGRLQSGVKAKLLARCHVTEITQAGFVLVQR